MKTVSLKKDAQRRIFAGHLWIFSNDIDSSKSPLQQYSPGELISIETAFGKIIAIGYINPHCLLCIRILTLNLHDNIDALFFANKIKIAESKRKHLFSDNYYRVVFGESDRLPGLVIDRFNDILVIQINTAGMENLKLQLIEAIKMVFEATCLVLRCDSSERGNEGLNIYCEVIHGELPALVTVKENNCIYQIPLLNSQKTGWFYDHRLNRERIAYYCKNKRVLDVFSYCGAFTIPCAKIANEVIAIDCSEMAIKQLEENAALNALRNIKTICDDALAAMQQLSIKTEKFDVVILDPPAFIKRKKDSKAGETMYQKFNEAALQLLNPNGILFSASCSMHLSAENLLNIIRRAGINTHKELSILECCHQGPDHPIHPAMTETNYLKGYIVASTG